MPISKQKRQIWLFLPKFLEISKLNVVVWFNNVEGVAKSSVEAEIIRVKVGTRFSNTLKFINAYVMAKSRFLVEVTVENCSIDFIV